MRRRKPEDRTAITLETKLAADFRLVMMIRMHVLERSELREQQQAGDERQRPQPAYRVECQCGTTNHRREFSGAAPMSASVQALNSVIV
ncbi:MAG: hypothetical protein AAGI15_14875 [Pseudomonadota bacterium]